MPNPNHEPAGTEKGGQFARGNAAVNSMIRKSARMVVYNPPAEGWPDTYLDFHEDNQYSDYFKVIRKT